MQAIESKNWVIAPEVPKDIQEQLPGYHRLLQQLLYNRGVVNLEGADSYVKNKGSLYDPFLLKDMEKAVLRLRKAVEEQEKITVYGDYDCDGVCSTALLVDFLKTLNANVSGYIPDRFNEGYGLNGEAIAKLAQEGTQLLITVDCGIRSSAEVKQANELGMEVILTDHHIPGDEVPPALAVLDHKQEDDNYPEKILCGAGIAYKLVEAYLSRYEEDGLFPEQWLDLAAVATVADIVPLVGENRALVKAGLEVIQQADRVGLSALIRAAGMDPARFKASNIAFGVGPRINAAGRIRSATDALNLLLSEDAHEAATLAQSLDDLNGQRQQKTASIQNLADEQTQQSGDPYLIFTASTEFHMGVVGLAASRLTDTYYRPAVVCDIGNEFARASCRSIPEFHITHALEECEDMFDLEAGERFGGHAAAAGFTIAVEKLEALQNRLSIIAKRELEGKQLLPTVPVDVSFNFSYLLRNREGIYKLVQLLEPTGTENAPVLFAARNLRVVKSHLVGRDKTHLRITLSDGYSTETAIAFRQGHWKSHMPEYVDVLFTIDQNFFRGQMSYQIQVREIREHVEEEEA